MKRFVKPALILPILCGQAASAYDQKPHYTLYTHPSIYNVKTSENGWADTVGKKYYAATNMVSASGSNAGSPVMWSWSEKTDIYLNNMNSFLDPNTYRTMHYTNTASENTQVWEYESNGTVVPTGEMSCYMQGSCDEMLQPVHNGKANEIWSSYKWNDVNSAKILGMDFVRDQAIKPTIAQSTDPVIGVDAGQPSWLYNSQQDCINDMTDSQTGLPQTPAPEGFNNIDFSFIDFDFDSSSIFNRFKRKGSAYPDPGTNAAAVKSVSSYSERVDKQARHSRSCSEPFVALDPVNPATTGYGEYKMVVRPPAAPNFPADGGEKGSPNRKPFCDRYFTAGGLGGGNQKALAPAYAMCMDAPSVEVVFQIYSSIKKLDQRDKEDTRQEETRNNDNPYKAVYMNHLGCEPEIYIKGYTTPNWEMATPSEYSYETQTWMRNGELLLVPYKSANQSADYIRDVENKNYPSIPASMKSKGYFLPWADFAKMNVQQLDEVCAKRFSNGNYPHYYYSGKYRLGNNNYIDDVSDNVSANDNKGAIKVVASNGTCYKSFKGIIDKSANGKLSGWIPWGNSCRTIESAPLRSDIETCPTGYHVQTNSYTGTYLDVNNKPQSKASSVATCMLN